MKLGNEKEYTKFRNQLLATANKDADYSDLEDALTVAVLEILEKHGPDWEFKPCYLKTRVWNRLQRIRNRRSVESPSGLMNRTNTDERP